MASQRKYFCSVFLSSRSVLFIFIYLFLILFTWLLCVCVLDMYLPDDPNVNLETLEPDLGLKKKSLFKNIIFITKKKKKTMHHGRQKKQLEKIVRVVSVCVRGGRGDVRVQDIFHFLFI